MDELIQLLVAVDGSGRSLADPEFRRTFFLNHQLFLAGGTAELLSRFEHAFQSIGSTSLGLQTKLHVLSLLGEWLEFLPADLVAVTRATDSASQRARSFLQSLQTHEEAQSKNPSFLPLIKRIQVLLRVCSVCCVVCLMFVVRVLLLCSRVLIHRKNKNASVVHCETQTESRKQKKRKTQ